MKRLRGAGWTDADRCGVPQSQRALGIAEQNPKRSRRSQKTQGRAYRAKPLALPSEWVFSFSASMFADFVAV
jgi:hypothetical protein